MKTDRDRMKHREIERDRERAREKEKRQRQRQREIILIDRWRQEGIEGERERWIGGLKDRKMIGRQVDKKRFKERFRY